ncbi:MAG TPA: pentapeptide repeat-containing protein [Thermodesulfobacteriota bacterium]|nr:pentapeptide repeat-containing protein [Thermodesulfobacteriota bacterium]
MCKLKGRKRFYVFLVPALVLLLILIPISLNRAVGGPTSGTLNVRTENDFAANPDIFAIPGEDLVAVFLESLDCMTLTNDTGKKGSDVIPYRYTAKTEQTFCWQDPDETAYHYMSLVDSEGSETLRVDANGDCVTKEIEPGDYDMYLYHGNGSGKNVTVFIVPVDGRSVISTAPEETLESVSTIVDTDRCVGCDLSGANFFDADLREIDLGGAILDDTILANSNLSGANLSGASLRNADLTKANLEGADLSGADLTGAILINARLKNADLDGANLEGADLMGTGLSGTPGALVSSLGEDEPVSLSGIADEAPAVATCTTGAIAAGGGQDLEVTGPCTVPAGTYHYRNVHVYNGGSLTFEDAVINFWAYNIVIENNSSLVAGTPAAPIGTAGGKLTIHLYGDDQGNGGRGVTCKTDVRCGVPEAIWNSEGASKVCLPPNEGGDPTTCQPYDYFYHYHTLPVDTGDPNAYFGYKTLAVSYGGTLNLFGKKGATLPDSLPSSSSGTSWVRLDGTVDVGATEIAVDRPVDWEMGDRIVVTTTDYLPGHSELLEITNLVSNQKFGIKVLNPYTGAEIPGGLKHRHNGSTYPLTTVPGRLGLDVKVDGQPAAETRAAVALLSRSIRIVSAGDTFNAANPTCQYDCLPPAPYHFGGHTSVRQGFKEVHIQGVEFYQLGQGGRMGHYPVHFHMARSTPADTFVKDSSVWDSMTRFMTIHASQGILLARNVGFMSIGHGYYLEDGTEINNKLYSNIGIFARAALDNAQNPRKVPGILAYTATKADTTSVPYHSDYAQPAVFWIMNGWNDFEYNMAAGANACGICYWWLPSAISGSSQQQKWESYASQQSNRGRAGDTPLKNFTGNYCTSAMNAFNTTADISQCLGVGGPGEPVLEPITVGNLSPVPNGDKDAETYYPKLGNLRHPTRCDQTDCSNYPTCSAVNRKDCMVAVLDKFTTAFNWAQTNFSAIWLRPQWYLVINSVVSDSQSAGLTFVTGGDYTQSNFLPGMWQLARQNVFIGNTQSGNPYASNIGPVNKDTTLTCENHSSGGVVANYCLLKDEGISFQLTSFANNQRMFNIYDGPSFEDSNAFLNIKKTVIDDCKPTSQGGNGNCFPSKSMYGRVQGMPVDKAEDVCSIPNAAIAWKQSNGFYYPPAFHSSNLYFGGDVEIRHFVIEPLFKDGHFSFQSDDTRVKEDYCTYTLNNPDPPNGDGKGGLFDGFTAIDRQTILNDDDGSLTGYKNTISVNEDPFFNAPAETIECESEGTAKTSPYEYVTTVVYPGCVGKKDCGGKCRSDGKPCADDSNCAGIPNVDNTCDDTDGFWQSDCGSSFCYGVPLYRQFLNQDEARSEARPQIRMMGMNFFQRSNLTANNGKYYIDTTVSRENQRNGLLLAPLQKPSFNVFTGYTGGEEYYVLLIFAKDTTKQTYQLFVGKGRDKSTPEKLNEIVHAIRSPLKQSRPLDVNTEASWPAKWVRDYDPDTGFLEVTLDLGDFKSEFDAARKDRCQPESFCAWTGDEATGTCGCSEELKTTNPALYDECVKPLGDNKNNICSWAVRAIDCPEGGCYGFAFTLPAGYTPPAEPVTHPATTCFPEDADWNVQFTAVSQEIAGSCFESNPPKPNFCAGGGQGGDPTPPQATPPPSPPPPPPPTSTPSPEPEPTPEPTPTGEVLTMETDEPPGENCEFGGTKIETGLDLNENGVLDEDEITDTTYACNDEEAGGGSGGSNCALAPSGSGAGSLAGLLVYSLLPAGILVRRRFRRAH